MLVCLFVLLVASGIVNANKAHSSCDLHGGHRIRCHGKNATHTKCPDPCPKTCQNPEGVEECDKFCEKHGCECKPGYVLSENGRCVLLQDCPDYLRCNGDRNATYMACPNPCPRTCQYPSGDGVCKKQCQQEGCECKEGYYLDSNGKCVQLQDCSGAKKCSSNETFVYCKAGCPTNYCPKDDSLAVPQCSLPMPCASGCACKVDYLRLSTEDDRCVLATECPPVKCTRPNEEWVPCIPPCPFNRCSDIDRPAQCNRLYSYCRPQCTCKQGFYKNDDNECIPKEDCPQTCGYNEVEVKCKTVCPPQTCKLSCPEADCKPGEATCERGCDCLPNHLRNDTGVCVPVSECPPRPKLRPCGFNEEPSYCKIVCPQTCDSILSPYVCNNTDTSVNVGCNCLSGYLRNASGICIPGNKCFSAPECDIPKKCRPTCANPNPKKCPSVELPSVNQDGCKCRPGFILDDPEGICIKVEECPNEGCDGDPNAQLTQSPWPCPATCSEPNASLCGKTCKTFGCQCKPGFILSKKNKKCILPEECKGGNPCGVNGTFAECGFRCPTQNCPDGSGLVACKAPRLCPPGCLCADGYKRNDDDVCVAPSDCPIPECENENEVWDECPSPCADKNCDETSLEDCKVDPDNCKARCVCINGYYRDENGECVPKKKCPKLCDVDQKCRPTCAVPNPSDCGFIKPAEENDDACNCQEGYVLSEPGGYCIKVEDCPNQGCNGDINARVKECPLACPSTCDAPNGTFCKRKCDPIGCECKPGYILSKNNGECIRPSQCPGGDPCGHNATFVSCKSECSTDYCPADDSRAAVVCETSSCLPGCVCKLNHRMVSRKDRTCIVSSECPPVKCTRPKEEWDPCPQECSSGYCEDVDKPKVTCKTLVLNCNPACVCKEDHYRNPEDDKCVSARKCRRINKPKKSKDKH